jgi:hypothetical protein
MKKSVTQRMIFVTFVTLEHFPFGRIHDGLLEDDRFENIKDLLNSNDQTVWKRIEEKARDLGEVTRDEIVEMGSYKLARNRGVHKGKG